MIKLKNLLTEDVNYILKKSPNAIISKAADLMAGVFRIKFKATRDEKSPPDFEHDVMYVLTSPKNIQYGPASSFANGDWYYIIGDDRKKAERRLVTDVLIYPKRKLVGVDKGKQKWEEIEFLFKTTPKSSGKVGSSDIIKVSDFVSAIDPKADRIPETLGTGATLIKQINDILNNTIVDSPSSDEKEIVVVKKDGSSDDSKKDDSVVIDKKAELDDSTPAYALQPYKRKKDPAYPNGVNAPEISPTKSYFIKNLDLINSAKPDAMIAEDFQQLIVQKVLKTPAYDVLPAVQEFKKIKNPVDGWWATKSKNVIYELNQAYGIGDTDQVTKQLIDKLFTPLKTESIFSLKSILREGKLQEQDLSGFDPTKVKPRTQVTATTTVKKEVPKTTTSTSTKTVPKTTTPAVKTPTKSAVTPKKEPAKSSSLKVTTDKPYRRGIENVAKELKAKLRWDAKLKVWYIDREIGISIDWDVDKKAFLHLRDDGTLMLKVYNVRVKGYGFIVATGITELQDLVIVKGVGSGWSNSGKNMTVQIALSETASFKKLFSVAEWQKGNKKTINISGSSFLACLQKALQSSGVEFQRTDGFWFPTTDKYGN